VLVTTGTAEANFLALYRLLEPGDEFVTLMPTYMQCVNLARSLGAAVRVCPLEEDNDYRLDLDALRSLVTRKTKVILLVNPNNPTGTVLSPDKVRVVCQIAGEVGSWVLCDGALRALEVDGRLAATPLEYYDKGIATGSVSKIGLAGPRIGWLIGSKELVADCWAYRDYTTLGHSSIGEQLASLALAPDLLPRLLARARGIVTRHSSLLADWIAARRDVFGWVPPRAGHTAFVRYDLPVDSVQLCTEILREQSVLIGPGDFFEWPRHLRIRYGCDEETLQKGLDHFSRFLDRRRSGGFVGHSS
jgi:aspartate/methionine/tyrosine aminotransferase